MNYLSLRQAAAQSPGQPSSNAVWRWARRGVRAANGETVRLQHIRVGARLYTTEQWLADFFALLAETDAGRWQHHNRISRRKPHNTQHAMRAAEEQGL